MLNRLTHCALIVIACAAAIARAQIVSPETIEACSTVAQRMVVIWGQRDAQPMERFLFEPAEDDWQRMANESIRLLGVRGGGNGIEREEIGNGARVGKSEVSLR